MNLAKAHKKAEFHREIGDAVRNKMNRDMTEAFVREVEAKVREMAWEEAKQEALAYWNDRIEHCLLQDYHYAVLFSLHDYDGYGQKRGIDILAKVETVISDIGDLRITKEDVREVVNKEMLIAIEEDGIYKLKKNGDRELAIKFNYVGSEG